MNNNKVKDDINSTNKEIIAKLRKAQADFTEVGVRNALNDLLLTDAVCLLYTSPSPRDKRQSRMPSSA